jgi:hypothetical protein
MNNSSQKHEEILMTEEEPIPEEYKQSKFQINSNAIKPSISTAYNTSKKFQALSGPNIVLSSKPNVNNINNINSMNKKLYTDNNINNKNKNNNSITLSRVSKAKTTLSNYDNSKYENYNLEKMRYDFLKKYSYIHVDKDENFLNRMKFDIFKRQSKEEKINALVDQHKAKIDEDERVSTFNRLISDANRRIEAQDNLENMKNKLSEDIINTDKKKYNYEVWNEIYNKRFKNYAENCNKKKEEEYKKKEILKKKEEIDEINLCKSKKKPQKLIDEASKRMYDEAKRRKIKMNEKIDRINKYNNEIEDASKYTKKIKSESYTFIDEDDLNDNTNNNRLSYNDFYVGKKINNKEKMKKTKGMSVAEFNNKRFEKKPRGGKSYNGKNISNLNKMNEKYFNDYMKKNEQLYKIEKEKEKNNNLKSIKNNNDNDNNNKIGVSNIVEQFFLRQINDKDNII